MPQPKLSSGLATLEESKREFGSNDAKLLRVLRSLSKASLSDADSLIRLHEALLFFRAYPTSKRVLNLVEQLLKNFASRVARLGDDGADLSSLDDPEVSGIVGTTVTSNFSYAIARWLAQNFPSRISIDWDWLENEDQFGATLPRFLPLLDDDAMVEAHVPFREWLRSACGPGNELVWLIGQFERLKMAERQKAELYDALKIHVTWRFRSSSSRTAMKLPVRKTFFHDRPLIQRRQVSLAGELNSPPLALERLSPSAGERILNLAKETSSVRYRELHGFTYGDAGRVVRASIGRGTDVYVMGVPPEHRLPLRAYHAALIFKNEIPVGYFEGLSICERMESGFNLYYTFREGETAWLYARILRLMRQLLNVTVFSIAPYQIGHENEEGIQSGAFWFYRKLGFRPARADLMKLALSEEQKIARNKKHRTSLRTLRKLAAGHMLFELNRSGSGHAWERFEVRRIGLAVQRRMAGHFGGEPQKIRAHSVEFVRRALRLSAVPDTKAFSDLALVLAMVPNLTKWSAAEKQLAARCIVAKTGRDEALYLKQMQKHASLRASLIRLGSGSAD